MAASPDFGWCFALSCQYVSETAAARRIEKMTIGVRTVETCQYLVPQKAVEAGFARERPLR